ncbi:MAG TPA: tRNA (adenosine(37)-N6)-dimethylallyltransferase MiaA [Marmoricola sp.]|nr:tRNA (adenosine(37)-N6)-dimethylallyltransferase MiaA [Marmoricola sp.]
MADAASVAGTAIVAIVGATATGKSNLALDLAQRLGGEIINTDAMQVYRGMDIGTAKLPADERRGIPHHLIDIAEIRDVASVAEFQRMAREAIDDCRTRGVAPILVGGSALYTRAILDEFEFPGTDPEVRSRLEAELKEVGSVVLHQRLESLDPQAAQGILTSNGRRIVRALEVIELNGSFTSSLPQHVYRDPETLQIGLDIDRPTLDQRIALRVDRMWEEGLVEEVRGLIPRGLRESRTASRAIGYQQALAFIDGDMDETVARDQIAAATRRFARRQDSWFRKDPRVRWLPHEASDLATRAIALMR